MKTIAEEKVHFIKERCETRGAKLSLEEHHDPVHFFSLTNDKGDIASVSDTHVTYEPKMYSPPWSDYMKNWAKSEGFSEESIRNQNLIRTITVNEAVEYLSA